MLFIFNGKIWNVMIADWKGDTVLVVCTCIPDEFCIAMTLFLSLMA